MFEKYYMKPIISKNLTPLPPFPTREWGFQSVSPRRGEVWRGVSLYIKNFSNILLVPLPVSDSCCKLIPGTISDS
ncbi:MAG TPA: hypothetical protein DIU28_04640 [Anabaena sp. UBA12330]|nr:hypothetical protein [Anabaena sp. UBA12330]